MRGIIKSLIIYHGERKGTHDKERDSWLLERVLCLQERDMKRTMKRNKKSYKIIKNGKQ